MRDEILDWLGFLIFPVLPVLAVAALVGSAILAPVAGVPGPYGAWGALVIAGIGGYAWFKVPREEFKYWAWGIGIGGALILSAIAGDLSRDSTPRECGRYGTDRC